MEKRYTISSIIGFALVIAGFTGHVLQAQIFPIFYVLSVLFVLPLAIFKVKSFRALSVRATILSTVSAFGNSLYVMSMRVLAVYSAIFIGSSIWLLQELSVGDFNRFFASGPFALLLFVVTGFAGWLGLRGMVFVFTRIVVLRRKELITSTGIALATLGYLYFFFQPSWFALCLVQVASVVSVFAGVRYYSGDFVQRLYEATRDVATASIIVLIISLMMTAAVLPNPFYGGRALGWTNGLRDVDEASVAVHNRVLDVEFDRIEIGMAFHESITNKTSLARLRASSRLALETVRDAKLALERTGQTLQRDQIQLMSLNHLLSLKETNLDYLGNLTVFFQCYGEVMLAGEMCSLANLTAQKEKVKDLLLQLREAQQSSPPLHESIQIVTLKDIEEMYNEATYFTNNPPPRLSFKVSGPTRDVLPGTKLQVDICVQNDGKSIARQILIKQMSSSWFGPSQMIEVPDLQPLESAVVTLSMTANYPNGTAGLEPWKYEPTIEASWKDTAGEQFGPRRVPMGFANVRPSVEITASTEEALAGYRIAIWTRNKGFAEATDAKLTVVIPTSIKTSLDNVSPTPLTGARMFSWKIGNLKSNQTIGPFTIEIARPGRYGEIVVVEGIKVEYSDQAGNNYQRTAPAVRVTLAIPSYFVPALTSPVGFVQRLYEATRDVATASIIVLIISLMVTAAVLSNRFVKMVILAIAVFLIMGIVNLVWMMYKSPLHFLLLYFLLVLPILLQPAEARLVSWNGTSILFALFLLWVLGTQDIIHEG